MKNRKFYFTIVSLFLVGLGTVFLYRQQLKGKALEFEGYEIEALEKRIDNLYNKEKTDINKNIVDEINELEFIFDNLDKKEISLENIERINKTKNHFITAQDMHKLQENILILFEEEGIVVSSLTRDMINNTKKNLDNFEDKSIYYERNSQLIEEAENQLEVIEKVKELIDSSFVEGEPVENVSSEELENLLTLIDEVKNSDLRERFATRVTGILREEEQIVEEPENEDVELVVEDPVETVDNELNETNQNTNQTSNNVPELPQSNDNVRPPANNQNERREEETETEPSVVSRSRRIVIEDIPYSTAPPVEIASQEKGTQRVYKPGSKGTREIIYETVKYSDGSTETRTVSNKIKTDPTDEVIYIGTREPEQPDSEEEIEGNQGE